MILGRFKGRGKHTGKALLLEHHALSVEGVGALEFAEAAEFDAAGRIRWAAGEGDAFRTWVLDRARDAGWKPPVAEEAAPIPFIDTPAAEAKSAMEPRPAVVEVEAEAAPEPARECEPRAGMSPATRIVLGVIATLAFAAMIAAALSRPIEQKPLTHAPIPAATEQQASQ